MNDEDSFSDDATFDALDEGELRALEEQAVRSTQLHQEGYDASDVQQPRHQYHNPRQENYQPSNLSRVNEPVQAPFKPHRTPLQHQQQRLPPTYQKPQSYISYSQQKQQWKAPQSQANQPLEQHTHQHTEDPNQRSFVPPQQQLSHQNYEEEPTLPINAHHTTIIPETSYTYNNNTVLDGEASSDYGDIDGFEETAELWDTPVPGVIGAHQEAQKYPVVSRGADIYNQPGMQDWIEQQQELGQIADDVVMANSQHDAPPANAVADADNEALKARIAQLEQLNLKKDEDHQKTILAKMGEVAIVRNKQEQIIREYDRKIAQINNTHGEEKEKLKTEVEMLKVARDRTQTELVFVTKERDDAVRRERTISRKIQQSQQPQQEAPGQIPKSQELVIGGVGVAPRNGTTTPQRKDRSYAYRDGFEDDDIQMLSPSRQGRKTRTPIKTGMKRKRSVHGSPLPQLSLTQSRNTSIIVERAPTIDDKMLEKLFSQDDRLEFFEAIILHRCPSTQERIFDALMKFSFPSSAQTTLSSYFLDKITALRTTAENGAFSVGVSRVLLGMWSRCLQEGFFGALPLVVELFRFGILWTQGGHCFQVMDEALNLIQKTVDINAIPAAMKRDGCERTAGIPTIACLQIMEDIALASLGEEVYIKRFWKQIRVDFPIMCLHPGQPLELIHRMASILCTSVVNDTFGPITSTSQRENEKFLLEAATKPLEMVPKQPPKEKKYTAMQVLELRLEVLQFLGCVCSTESGMLAMAKHENAVSRVAIRIAEEVDQCYEWRLGEGSRLDFINFAVRLLHGIITSHPDEANGKLATHHKHLVSMTRIAFSEGIAQEAGLESDVIDCAFSLLENMITPDEAIALESMFNT